MKRIFLGRVAAMLPPLLLVAGAPAGGGDTFDHVFSPAGEPAFLHYRVLYRGPDGIHRMEVWRDHDRRVKRLTDQALAVYATREGKGPGYRLSMLDLRRRIHTIVDRTNLYRIGEMTDWFDLGHGLRHPRGNYTIAPGKAPAGTMPAVPGKCRWYDLTSAGRVSHICWDTTNRVPLLMTGADGKPIWRVTGVDTRPIAAATFTFDDRGFVRNDANQDISPD